MCSVAERLIYGSSATTERERSFPRQIVSGTAGIYQLDGTLGRLNSIGPIRFDRDLDRSHETSRTCDLLD